MTKDSTDVSKLKNELAVVVFAIRRRHEKTHKMVFIK